MPSDNSIQNKIWTTTLPRSIIYQKPELGAPIETQLLYGEPFEADVFVNDDWVHGFAPTACSSGYMLSASALRRSWEPTHRVIASDGVVRSEPDDRAQRVLQIGQNALVRVTDIENRYAKVNRGWMHECELVPVDEIALDFVDAAELNRGSPYIWGGRDSVHGIDCSGLVVNALLTVGIRVPHSANLMRNIVGEEVELVDDRYPFKRGDLVFWPGHVGIMLNERDMLHAIGNRPSGIAMRTVVEPVDRAILYYRNFEEKGIAAVRRLPAK